MLMAYPFCPRGLLNQSNLSAGYAAFSHLARTQLSRIPRDPVGGGDLQPLWTCTRRGTGKGCDRHRRAPFVGPAGAGPSKTSVSPGTRCYSVTARSYASLKERGKQKRKRSFRFGPSLAVRTFLVPIPRHAARATLFSVTRPTASKLQAWVSLASGPSKDVRLPAASFRVVREPSMPGSKDVPGGGSAFEDKRLAGNAVLANDHLPI